MNTVPPLEAALCHLSPRVCADLLWVEQDRLSLPPCLLKGGDVFSFSLTAFYITAEYFLSFSSLLKLTMKDGKSAIIIFLSSFTSNHFSLSLLVPVLLYIGTHGVSGTFTLCICRIYWWRHREGQEQNSLLVTNHGWKQPVLMIFLLNGSQKVEILTKHRNYYFANKLV